MEKRFFLALVLCLVFVLAGCVQQQPQELCGNNIADAGETCSSCPVDVQCGSGEVCENGVCIEPDVCGDDQCGDGGNELQVAAIRLAREDYSLQNLQDKVNSILAAHPSVDLIITPEFLFYGGEYRENPVAVDCVQNSCAVESTGTQKSDEIKAAVDFLQDAAAANSVNILFGTIAEKGSVQGTDVSYNTLLVIDRQGNIIGRSRKSSRYDFYLGSGMNCSENTQLCEQIIASALETIKSFSLSSAEGINFKIAPVICGDKDKEDVMGRLENSNAEIIALTECDAFDYTSVMQEIEAGENPFENPAQFSDAWIIKYYFMEEYVEKGIAKSSGYLLVSNGCVAGGSAAIISLQPGPIQGLEIAADFTYGELQLGQ